MEIDLTELIWSYPVVEGVKQVQVEKTVFKVYFDGGGSNQFSYGSWEIEWNGFKKRAHRKNFGHYGDVTSNMAEYLALIGALQWLQSVKFKQQYRLKIHGDSMLVVNQVNGGWKCHNDRLAKLREGVVTLLRGFDWSIHWHRRINSVSRFGH